MRAAQRVCPADARNQRFCHKRYESGMSTERKVLPVIQRLFGEDTFKTDVHHPLDFYCPSKRTWLELKHRSHYKNKYPTSIVPASKVAFARSLLDKGDRVIFLFLFEDGLFQYEFTGQDLQLDYIGDQPPVSHFPVSDMVKRSEIFS